jgi:hypothetical protein
MHMRLLNKVLMVCAVPLGGALAADSPPHCNLGLLSKAERKRDAELGPQLGKAVREVKELPNGYGFRFDAAEIAHAGEMATIASKCCQPLTYELELGPQPGGTLWVRITGGEGAKEFIHGEFEHFFENAGAAVAK